MALNQSNFSIALVAGGKSSRMGKDKALLPFGGKPLFLFIVEQIRSLSDDIFIVSNHPEDFKAAPYPIYTDVIREIGALGGIYTALSYAKNPLCLALACDMPFISLDLIDHLIAEAPGFDAVIPSLGEHKLEPFRAVYRKTCLDPIQAAIEAGERRAVSFLSKVKTKTVDIAQLEALDPGLRSFVNINTPDDLANVEAML